MDCFYIITNKLKDPDYAVTDQIRSYIEQSGRKAVLSVKDEEGHIVPGTVPEDADCALVLGGDGTLIRAVRDMDGSAMPLLGSIWEHWGTLRMWSSRSSARLWTGSSQEILTSRNG